MEIKSLNEPGATPLQRKKSRVVLQQALSPALFELQLERAGLDFSAGDEILLHGDRPEQDRTYSIASGENSPTLRILYRLIPKGARTPELTQLKPGMDIDFTGPTGSFHVHDSTAPCWFIATGTGIAPAISFLETYPDINLTILHGVRAEEDLIYNDWLNGTPYIPCVSGSTAEGAYAGRVTRYLLEYPLKPGCDVYLCGSNRMIEEVRALLLEQGHDGKCIFSEPYYFW
jgi:ferredoxin-NADP reductase